jgi:uncharacterized protein (TIGR02996 family)
MPDEDAFLKAIQHHPEDAAPKMAYADWLAERGDPRSEALQLGVALGALPPDHLQRPAGEAQLSRLRLHLDADWLTAVGLDGQPRNAHGPVDQPVCDCFRRDEPHGAWPESMFHTDVQDTACAAWTKLLDLVEEAARDGRSEFAPLADLSWEERRQIVTLPPSIAKLKEVRHLMLYRSFLVRMPPEIGEMASLETFTPYTSHRLHWFPYEITRCTKFKDSTVSTRVLYGNYKFRPPFPQLDPAAVQQGTAIMTQLAAGHWNPQTTRSCSVCDQPFMDQGRYRVWISLPVATDVLPLLVNACSSDCLARLPQPPGHYVSFGHRGGRTVEQPPDSQQAMVLAEAA